MTAPGRTAADLAERLLAGDKRALARAISLVENDDPEGWALVREVYPRTGRASMVGFTGPPGVGKSTLIGRLVEHARGREREVAVLRTSEGWFRSPDYLIDVRAPGALRERVVGA